MHKKIFSISLFAISSLLMACEGRSDGGNSGSGTNSTNSYLGKEDSSNGHNTNSEIDTSSSKKETEPHSSVNAGGQDKR